MMGWSAGAALAVMAGAGGDKAPFEGVAAVSLPKTAVRAWHWQDRFAFLPFIREKGPYFSTLPLIPRVTPSPLLIIQSSNDPWVPKVDREELFAVAPRPRRRIFLHGRGHSFPGARAQFFERLEEGLSWVRDTHERDLAAGSSGLYGRARVGRDPRGR